VNRINLPHYIFLIVYLFLGVALSFAEVIHLQSLYDPPNTLRHSQRRCVWFITARLLRVILMVLGPIAAATLFWVSWSTYMLPRIVPPWMIGLPESVITTGPPEPRGPGL
jgi:hypothetical protein